MIPAPIVSIVLPVYNAGTLLPLALGSVFRQSFQEWELILIDDGSTDACMAGFGVPDPRVRVVQDGRNEGLAARLNQGIDLARGRYLARMDQDDIAYPERLKLQANFLESNPDIDLVASRTLLFRGDGSIVGLSPLRRTHREICAAPWRGFFLPHPTWMGRIEWFRRHRYRIPEYVRAEDQELLLRSYRTSRFACLPEVLLGYRQTGLPLRKVLLARKHLAISQWSVNMAQGHPGQAVLGFLAYALKAMADAALAAAGAQRLFVQRQARGAPQEEINRWREIWKESQPRSGASPPSPSATDSAISESPDRHERPRICIVVAAPLTLRAFMLEHLNALTEIAQVTAVADFAPEDESFPWPAGLSRVAIPIARPIAPWADLVALLALYRLFRAQHFDLVHSVTPKAGLLAMLAAKLAGVPLRLHSYTGQVWITRRGWMRTLLKGVDRMIAKLATHVLADSHSQRDFLIAEGIVTARKSAVLARGSICGVDMARFRPDAAARERVRASHGLAPAAVVYLYLGRINRDKGLVDLARAFAEVGAVHAQAHLLLVGPDEGDLRAEISAAAAGCAARLHFAGLTDRPQDFFAAADVFCLPSYREGFGTTIIEAAAAGVPAIGSRIYGITDAIVENETGLLFEAGNVRQLALCMATLADDEGMRRRMGESARHRAARDFSSAVVTSAWVDYYITLLAPSQAD